MRSAYRYASIADTDPLLSKSAVGSARSLCPVARERRSRSSRCPILLLRSLRALAFPTPLQRPRSRLSYRRSASRHVGTLSHIAASSAADTSGPTKLNLYSVPSKLPWPISVRIRSSSGFASCATVPIVSVSFARVACFPSERVDMCIGRCPKYLVEVIRRGCKPLLVVRLAAKPCHRDVVRRGLRHRRQHQETQGGAFSYDTPLSAQKPLYAPSPSSARKTIGMSQSSFVITHRDSGLPSMRSPPAASQARLASNTFRLSSADSFPRSSRVLLRMEVFLRRHHLVRRQRHLSPVLPFPDSLSLRPDTLPSSQPSTPPRSYPERLVPEPSPLWRKNRQGR